MVPYQKQQPLYGDPYLRHLPNDPHPNLCHLVLIAVMPICSAFLFLKPGEIQRFGGSMHRFQFEPWLSLTSGWFQQPYFWNCQSHLNLPLSSNDHLLKASKFLRDFDVGG